MENKIYNANCIEFMKNFNATVDLTLTDIPYGEVNRESNGLKKLNKNKADIVTFSLEEFLPLIYKITTGTIIVFCGIRQVSTIAQFFYKKQKNKLGTMRQLIWTKTNPSPMNGDYVYLSAIENAIWFKKAGVGFNAHCKKNYFSYPCGRSKLHPTEKNHSLLKELILDNSNENALVFDPCAGSGSHLLVAKENNRRYLGVELDQEYFQIAKSRLERE